MGCRGETVAGENARYSRSHLQHAARPLSKHCAPPHLTIAPGSTKVESIMVSLTYRAVHRDCGRRGPVGWSTPLAVSMEQPVRPRSARARAQKRLFSDHHDHSSLFVFAD